MSVEKYEISDSYLSLTELVIGIEQRHDWSKEELKNLYRLPFNDLLYAAQWIHRKYFIPNEIQMSTLLSIKTGACPEDCSYCPQSVRYNTEVEPEDLMPLEAVISAAKKAKKAGATRFCMGAAYRGPKDKQLEKIIEMIKAVKSLGLETCATLGLLDKNQALLLKKSGLDYYNHNLDTSENFYKEIITTRNYSDRLKTLQSVRASGMKVCCGGILGLGEDRDDRIMLMQTLANMPTQPESVPINNLVRSSGTPLEKTDPIDMIEFVRTVAVARIIMPKSHVRLSAGRADFSDEMQALCFMAGANSIFYGDKLLTTKNPDYNDDLALLSKLGLKTEDKCVK
ncbi:MAG: biotin synthase BioB [Gammaproteobacteria bacterium]|nr:biotin synthase BioB [Gammaproteobacteria bacterium]